MVIAAALLLALGLLNLVINSSEPGTWLLLIVLMPWPLYAGVRSLREGDDRYRMAHRAAVTHQRLRRSSSLTASENPTTKMAQPRTGTRLPTDGVPTKPRIAKSNASTPKMIATMNHRRVLRQDP